MKRNVTFGTLTTAVAVTILIGSEVIVIAFAALWAISGFFGGGPVVFWACAITFGAAALAIVARVAVFAYAAETDPANA
jgi:hypothetical protein